jgi:hypothetical protein
MPGTQGDLPLTGLFNPEKVAVDSAGAFIGCITHNALAKPGPELLGYASNLGATSTINIH